MWEIVRRRKRGRPGGVKRFSKTVSLPEAHIKALEASGKASSVVEDALNFYARKAEFERLMAFLEKVEYRGAVMCIKCEVKFSILRAPECPECRGCVVAITWVREL